MGAGLKRRARIHGRAVVLSGVCAIGGVVLLGAFWGEAEANQPADGPPAAGQPVEPPAWPPATGPESPPAPPIDPAPPATTAVSQPTKVATVPASPSPFPSPLPSRSPSPSPAAPPSPPVTSESPVAPAPVAPAADPPNDPDAAANTPTPVPVAAVAPPPADGGNGGPADAGSADQPGAAGSEPAAASPASGPDGGRGDGPAGGEASSTDDKVAPAAQATAPGDVTLPRSPQEPRGWGLGWLIWVLLFLAGGFAFVLAVWLALARGRYPVPSCLWPFGGRGRDLRSSWPRDPGGSHPGPTEPESNDFGATGPQPDGSTGQRVASAAGIGGPRGALQFSPGKLPHDAGCDEDCDEHCDEDCPADCSWHCNEDCDPDCQEHRGTAMHRGHGAPTTLPPENNDFAGEPPAGGQGEPAPGGASPVVPPGQPAGFVRGVLWPRIIRFGARFSFR